MRVFVVGATGILGRHTLPRLVERGHVVCAVARHTMDVDRLQRLGVEAHSGDILDVDSLRDAIQGCDAALHLATAIGARPTEGLEPQRPHSARGDAQSAGGGPGGRRAPLCAAEHHIALW